MSPPLRDTPYWAVESARNVLAGAIPVLLAVIAGFVGVVLILLPLTR
jgi:hypothetical protein